MKSKFITGSFILLAISVGTGWLSFKPNFTGSWRLDTSRSVGLRQGMEINLMVKHEGDTLEVEAKTTVPQQPDIVQKDTYKLDGVESEFTPAQPPNAKGKRTGQWLPRGNGFLINETINAPDPKGQPTTTNITRKWILAPDGSQLTQDLYIDDARGSREVKRIFVKK